MEYFWLEKYFTVLPPPFIIARDSVIAFIALVPIIKMILTLKHEYKEIDTRDNSSKVTCITSFVTTMITGFVHFLCAGENAY